MSQNKLEYHTIWRLLQDHLYYHGSTNISVQYAALPGEEIYFSGYVYCIFLFLWVGCRLNGDDVPEVWWRSHFSSFVGKRQWIASILSSFWLCKEVFWYYFRPIRGRKQIIRIAFLTQSFTNYSDISTKCGSMMRFRQKISCFGIT